MEIAVAAGGMIDLATKDDVDKHHHRLEQLLSRPRAHFSRLNGSAPTRAAPVVVDCGRPPMGMMWLPQWAIGMGNDALGAVIANVTWAMFAGAIPQGGGLAVGPPTVGLDLGNCILTGTGGGLTAPTIANFPDKSPVYGNENLYGVFSGAGLAAGAQFYRLVVGVLELPFTDEALTW